jgi:hypothetical protein
MRGRGREGVLFPVSASVWSQWQWVAAASVGGCQGAAEGKCRGRGQRQATSIRRLRMRSMR